MCGLQSDEEKDDGDDKGGLVSVLIPHQEAKECQKGCRHESPTTNLHTGQVRGLTVSLPLV